MTATAQGMLPFGSGPVTGGLAIRPRPYQAAALDTIAARYRAGITRQMVVLPTGTGKTVVFAYLVDRRRPGRALILAHRDELIQQAAGKLAQVSGGGLDIGIVKARQDEAGAPVVVASVQTLARPGRVERLGRFDTVIADECHHSVSPTWRDVLDRLGCLDPGGPLTVGFTATAQRTDKLALGTVWQEIVYKRGIMQMIGEGYLVDVRGQQIGSDFDLGNLKVKAGDFTDGSIGDELERSDALAAVVAAYRRYADGRLAVGFTPTIATAHMLAAAFAAEGIPAEAVDGTMAIDERRAVLARLHRGETRVVGSCAVLSEGWDEPAVSCALMLRPTKSAPFFTQMVGRILRPFVSKTDAIVLDVAGATDLGLATLATLAGLKPGSVKPGQPLTEAAEEEDGREQRRVAVGVARTRQVELLRRSERHWVDVDGSWVLPTAGGVMILVPAGTDLLEDAWEVWRSLKGERPARESGTTLTLDWARGVGEELARAHDDDRGISRSDAAWRARPSTPSQRSALERFGYLAKPGALTAGAASDLITAKYAARDIKRIRRAAR